MIGNHYGRTVDSETPIVGVISNNSAEWLHEACDNGIDLSYEDFIDELRKEHEGYRNSKFAGEHADDFDECEECEKSKEYYESDEPTYLIGSWKLVNGMYEPDTGGEYAAKVSYDAFNCTQVLWSRYASRSELCSPCFPGQADLDTPGEYLAYQLPPDMFGDDDMHLDIIKLDA